jgi:hypothetical protein
LVLKGFPVESGSVLVELLLASAKLAESGEEDFKDSPTVFYSYVYNKKAGNDFSHPRIVSRRFLDDIIGNSIEMASYLLENQPDECLMRYMAIFIRNYEKFEMIPLLINWLIPVLGHDGPLIEIAAKISLLSNCCQFFPLDVCIDIFNWYVMGALTSGVIILQTFGSRLLKRLLKRDLEISPNPAAIDQMMTFLPDCPTGFTARALATTAKLIPELVLPNTERIVTSVIGLISSGVRSLQSEETDESVKDDIEEVIMEELSVLSDFMAATGRYFMSDELLGMIEMLLVSGILGPYEEFGNPIALLLRTMLLSGTERFADIIHLMVSVLAHNEQLWGIAWYLTEPLQAFIGDNPETFSSVGISAAVVGFCGEILASESLEIDLVLSIGGLVANLAFIDQSVTGQCNKMSTDLLAVGKIQAEFSSLEIAVAMLVGTKKLADALLVDRMVGTVTECWIINAPHRRLFEIGFVIALGLGVESSQVLESLMELFTTDTTLEMMTSDGQARYWSEMPIPAELEVLNMEPVFRSVYMRPMSTDMMERTKAFLQQAMAEEE